jgi:threonine dehydrogenase-like Zn-dependent dehydrogenase
VQPGESVAILGAGKLGLSVLDVLCHSAGPALTIVTDMQPFRLETARRLGADHVVNATQGDPVEHVMEITNGVGVDCVIECVGHYHAVEGQEAPLAQAVKMIRNAGRIVALGLGEQLSAVHFKTLVIKEAQIIASRKDYYRLGFQVDDIRAVAQQYLRRCLTADPAIDVRFPGEKTEPRLLPIVRNRIPHEYDPGFSGRG